VADCVVDTNVALKWVLHEPDSAAAGRVTSDVATAGGVLFFLDLALVEAVNVIWLQFHRRLCTEARARTSLADLHLLPVKIIDVRPHLDDAFDLALRFDIAVYDACFVAAVTRLGCPGVTADVPLVRKVSSTIPSIKLLKNW